MAEIYEILLANRHTASGSGISIPDGPAVPMVSLDVAAMDAGVYALEFSSEFQMPDVNDSIILVMASTSGSITTFTERKESSDILDNTAWNYGFDITHPGGIFNLSMTGEVSVGGNTATIFFANLIANRVG